MIDITGAVERLYTDKFTTYEYTETTDSVTHQTYSDEVAVLKDIPCRCSYTSDNVATLSDGVYRKAQTVRLITNVRHNIKPGTKIVITKATGEVVAYKSSGQGAFYPSHQEINLELWEEYT